jgi:hypothetical protein
MLMKIVNQIRPVLYEKNPSDQRSFLALTQGEIVNSSFLISVPGPISPRDFPIPLNRGHYSESFRLANWSVILHHSLLPEASKMKSHDDEIRSDLALIEILPKCWANVDPVHPFEMHLIMPN